MDDPVTFKDPRHAMLWALTVAAGDLLSSAADHAATEAMRDSLYHLAAEVGQWADALYQAEAGPKN